MNILVVYCHPVPESFGSALKEAVLDGLDRAGHAVRFTDLYAIGFQPEMTADERRGYHTEGDNVLPVESHVADIRWAEALVFVYPTWWYGLPAMLKGWMDRVLVPHVAFTMPTATQGIRGNLRNIRRITVVTTCGATWWLSKLVGEPGRRTILRGLRSICHPVCRTRYLALYRMDTRSDADRKAYLARVHKTMTRFR